MTLGAPFWDPWYTFAVFFFYLGTLGLHLGILGPRLGTLEINFGVFLRLWGGTLDPFSDFSEKCLKKYKKGQKKGAEMEVFFMEFRIFPESDKQCSDCAGANGLGFTAFILCLFASTFATSFCHRFCMLFGSTWEPRFTTPGTFGGRGGTSLLLFNKAHSESSLYYRARSAPGLLPTA